jgi:hypothetical protein
MNEVPPFPATAASWQKSSATNTQECLEMLRTRTRVWVRDSKDPRGPVLEFAPVTWAAFLGGVRQDQFGHVDSRRCERHPAQT